MNAPRLLAVLVALVGLVLAVTFGLRPLLERPDRRADAPERTAAVREDAATVEAPAAADLLPDAERGRGAVDALAAAGPLRAVDVTVAVPAGSPADPDLAVVAVAADFAADADLQAMLRRVRAGDHRPGSAARAPVGPAGIARLSIPAGIARPVLVVDGRYLFLDAPVALPDGAETARLEPRLGGCLVVRPTGGDGAVRGGLTVAGADFSGASRGFVSRRRDVAGEAEVVYPALDPRLTWSVVPTFDEHHADFRWGLELEPGEERVLDLPVIAGATLAGRVVGPDGDGLPDVEVRTAGGNPWMQGADVRSTATGADGAFVLRAVRPGAVTLEARSEGWRTATTDELEAADGARVEGLVLTLDRGLAIAGRAVLDGGAAAEGATVVAEATRSRQGFGGWGGAQTVRAGEARADADGAFAITGLDEGAYTVRAEREDGGSVAWRAAAPAVAAGTDGLVLTLAGPVAFTGRVVDDRALPVAAFAVEAESADAGGPTERADFADDDGRFTFARVGPGDWRVTASAAGHRQLEPTPLTLPGGGDLELVLVRLGAVAGAVVDAAGSPVPGATVAVQNEEARGNPWAGFGGRRAETDGEGAFELGDLDPGAVTLVARREGFADSEPYALELPPGGRVEGLLLALRIGGRIEGGVVGPDGDPVAGQRVTWGSSSMGFGSRGETRTDGAGLFAFDHVTPGSWSVTAAPGFEEMAESMQGRDVQTAWVDVMGRMVSETVDVADGEVVEVWLGGEPRVPVRVFGTVAQGGRPVAGAQVTAVSEGSAVFQGMKAAQTDADGAYELVVDRPGAYVISATSGRVGVEAYVDVPRADETRVDLAVPRGGIEGTVRKPGGRPAAGVRLSLQREDGLGRLRWGGDQATTDEEGGYSFPGLEAGVYTVRANVATWGGQPDEDFGSAIETGVAVEADETTAGVDLRLEPAGAVEGLVEGAGGLPAAGVTVFFRAADGTPVTRVSTTVTDSGGRFRRGGLAPGTYALSARTDALASGDEATVTVRSGETAAAKLVVDDGVWVLVRLEDPDGLAQRARVEVLDGRGTDVGGLVTMAQLQAAFNEGFSSTEQRLGPFPAGRYTVRATLPDGTSKERRVTLRAGQEERVVKLRLGE